MTSMREIIRAFWSSSARICSIALSSSAISAFSSSLRRFWASIIELTVEVREQRDDAGERDRARRSRPGTLSDAAGGALAARAIG